MAYFDPRPYQPFSYGNVVRTGARAGRLEAGTDLARARQQELEAGAPYRRELEQQKLQTGGLSLRRMLRDELDATLRSIPKDEAGWSRAYPWLQQNFPDMAAQTGPDWKNAKPLVEEWTRQIQEMKRTFGEPEVITGPGGQQILGQRHLETGQIHELTGGKGTAAGTASGLEREIRFLMSQGVRFEDALRVTSPGARTGLSSDAYARLLAEDQELRGLRPGRTGYLSPEQIKEKAEKETKLDFSYRGTAENVGEVTSPNAMAPAAPRQKQAPTGGDAEAYYRMLKQKYGTGEKKMPDKTLRDEVKKRFPDWQG